MKRQTRKQFLQGFIGPPRRPWTPEEHAAAYERCKKIMDDWREQNGLSSRRRNNFHRIADAEQDRGAVATQGGTSMDSAAMAKRQALLSQAAVLGASMPSPVRCTPGSAVTCTEAVEAP